MPQAILAHNTRCARSIHYEPSRPDDELELPGFSEGSFPFASRSLMRNPDGLLGTARPGLGMTIEAAIALAPGGEEFIWVPKPLAL